MRPVKTSVDEGTLPLCSPEVKEKLKRLEKFREAFEDQQPLLDGRSEFVRRYSLMARATRRGILPRASEMPCEKCGLQAEHRHHDDYSKPLTVRFLCAKCHRQRHIELGWGIAGRKKGCA